LELIALKKSFGRTTPLKDVNLLIRHGERVGLIGANGSGAGGAEVTIESPLTGIVVDVRVTAGQEVQKGDVLLVIEAMKMQNEIRAPRAGKVKSVRPRTGQKVGSKDSLVVLA
jgi:biotin carboxyl carrier protein